MKKQIVLKNVPYWKGKKRPRQQSRAKKLSTTELGTEYTADDMEFLKAVEEFKRKNKVKFPTHLDILTIAKSLGYRKVI